ncbi:MAG: acyl-CoA dehydrogenase family protein [Candidatus Hydrogenedentota bacterium]|nr:MAG: acyl-CoA dehydrogenase family protein [Candidatus Hydrogenedentota bacterium]
MLDFSFTDEQDLLRKTLREFSLKELLPRYGYWDKNEEYPYEPIREILRIVNPYGSNWREAASTKDLIIPGIVAEEVARGDFNCVLPSLGPFTMELFLVEASDELKEMWFPGLITGEKVIGLCLTEPDAGSDLGSLRTTAVRDGDDYVLSGEKNSVSFLNADVFYVFARTAPDSTGPRGISAFLMPRETEGLDFSPYHDLGCRAVPRGQLFMNDARVPARYMVGREGEAFKMIMKYLDVNRAFIGLMCLGAAEQTLDETIEYVKQKHAFGVPISRFQGVAFPIAEAATRLELARLICYKILWKKQNGHPCTLEGAMAKWWVPKTCVDVIHECLLLHGHYGYTNEFPIEQRLRDVIGWQIGDGTAQIQKLIISRLLLGRDFAPLT